MRVTADDYAPLKAFFARTSDRLLPFPAGAPDDARPLAMLERFEAQSMATARTGLGMAIGDLVEMTEGLSREQVAAIDAELAAGGLWTLSEVRGRFGRAVQAIMKRGSVRNESEYHALRNVVDAMPEPARADLWRLLAAFEARMGEEQE